MTLFFSFPTFSTNRGVFTTMRYTNPHLPYLYLTFGVEDVSVCRPYQTLAH